MTRFGLPRPHGVAGVTLAQAAALVLPFLFVAANDPGRYTVLFGVALVASLVWEWVFARLRKRPPSFHGLTTALVVAIVAPPEIAVWQVVVTVSLGVIFGELVFGGRGFGFLSPATVALALLIISFPELSLPAPTRELALATLPAAVLLWALGLISERVILSAVAATFAVLVASGQGIEPVTIATGLAFGLIFLICDPTMAAATNAGRWIYGALAGSLVGLFSVSGITTEAVIFAALMAGIFAPLVDHLVVLAHAYLRARRRNA